MRITAEVFALYEAFARGEDLQFPNTIAYRDYIAWLREQDLKEAESFWRRHSQVLRRRRQLEG